MNYKLIICVTLLLLSLAPTRSFNYFDLKYGPKKLSLKTTPLFNAYFLGNKDSMKRSFIQVHKALNLQHLMTPSGLHLGFFMIILNFFFNNQLIQFFILIFLTPFIYPIPFLDSFKRMYLFLLIRKNPIRSVPITKAFLFTFLLAFSFGQFQSNALSFTLSFLFLGAILCAKKNYQIFLFLFISQYILSHWFGKDFYPLGTIYGLLISLLSPIIFLFTLLEAAFPFFSFSKLWFLILSFLAKVKGPHLPFSIWSLMPFILLFTRKHLRLKSLVLGLFFMVGHIGPQRRTASFKNKPPESFQKIKRIKNGVKLSYPNGMYCYSRLKVDTWSTHCNR